MSVIKGMAADGPQRAPDERFYAGEFGVELTVKELGRKPTVREKTERLIWIADRIVEVVQEFDPGLVVIEDYAYAQRGNQTTMGEIRAAVLIRLHDQGYMDPAILTSTAARRLVLGDRWKSEYTSLWKSLKGTKPPKVKRLIRWALVDQLGFSDFETDNTMDAWVQARAGMMVSWANEGSIS